MTRACFRSTFTSFTPVNFLQQRLAQLAHAFIAIFAFGSDLNRFQDGVIGPFRIERIGRVGFVWPGRIHHSLTFLLR